MNRESASVIVKVLLALEGEAGRCDQASDGLGGGEYEHWAHLAAEFGCLPEVVEAERIVRAPTQVAA